MYVSLDGKRIFADPVCEPYSKDLHHEIFECDSLIAPVVALLLSKGYKTTFCCQGHLPTHDPIYQDDVDGYYKNNLGVIPISEAEEAWGFCPPYISFDASMISTLPWKELPDRWYYDFAHINPDYDHCSDDDDNCPYIYNEVLPEKDEVQLQFSIRLDDEYIDYILNDDYRDFFKFNKLMLYHIERLYNWAKELPDINIERKENIQEDEQ